MAEKKANWTLDELKLIQAIEEAVQKQLRPVWDSLQRIEKKLGIGQES